MKNTRYNKYDYRERLLRVTKINEWGKEHKWDNLMQCDFNNRPEPTPDSATPSMSPEAKTTTPQVPTTTRSVTTQASKSCEVTLVAKDSECYLLLHRFIGHY